MSRQTFALGRGRSQGERGEFLLYCLFCLFSALRWEKGVFSANFTFIIGAMSGIFPVVETRDIAYRYRMGGIAGVQ